MRFGKNGKTVKLEISVWWNARDKTIHLASSQSESLIATVNNDPKSMRGHPKLFRELAKILKQHDVPGPSPVSTERNLQTHETARQREAPDPGFHPVEIRGEPLSTTVIRERR
jgi:hypothetical protein